MNAHESIMAGQENVGPMSQRLSLGDVGEESIRSQAAVTTNQTGLCAFRWGWTALMVLATSLPYLVNFASTPAGYRCHLDPTSLSRRFFVLHGLVAAGCARSAPVQDKVFTALPQQHFCFIPCSLICGWISRLCNLDIGIVHLVVKEVGVNIIFRPLL